MLTICDQCHAVHPADHPCKNHGGKSPSRVSLGIALMGLSLAACSTPAKNQPVNPSTQEVAEPEEPPTSPVEMEMVALYGAPPEDYDDVDTQVAPAVDMDKDGHMPPADCDDANAAVNPAAKETAGDGVDSNCDGADDT